MPSERNPSSSRWHLRAVCHCFLPASPASSWVLSASLIVLWAHWPPFCARTAQGLPPLRALACACASVWKTHPADSWSPLGLFSNVTFFLTILFYICLQLCQHIGLVPCFICVWAAPTRGTLAHTQTPLTLCVSNESCIKARTSSLLSPAVSVAGKVSGTAQGLRRWPKARLAFVVASSPSLSNPVHWVQWDEVCLLSLSSVNVGDLRLAE